MEKRIKMRDLNLKDKEQCDLILNSTIKDIIYLAASENWTVRDFNVVLGIKNTQQMEKIAFSLKRRNIRR